MTQLQLEVFFIKSSDQFFFKLICYGKHIVNLPLYSITFFLVFHLPSLALSLSLSLVLLLSFPSLKTAKCKWVSQIVGWMENKKKWPYLFVIWNWNNYTTLHYLFISNISFWARRTCLALWSRRRWVWYFWQRTLRSLRIILMPLVITIDRLVVLWSCRNLV